MAAHQTTQTRNQNSTVAKFNTETGPLAEAQNEPKITGALGHSEKAAKVNEESRRQS